ncbi:hypothetical protein PAXRUDRAFT_121148, partial [Paxillus rubicundulus Ve08.2h10]
PEPAVEAPDFPEEVPEFPGAFTIGGIQDIVTFTASMETLQDFIFAGAANS